MDPITLFLNEHANPFALIDRLPAPWNYVAAVFLWPAITGIINAALWVKTPEEWVALAESEPKRKALIKALRTFGFEPINFLAAVKVLLSPTRPAALPEAAPEAPPAEVRRVPVTPENTKIPALVLPKLNEPAEPSTPAADPVGAFPTAVNDQITDAVTSNPPAPAPATGAAAPDGRPFPRRLDVQPPPDAEVTPVQPLIPRK
jgi:hypothetical protein